jgi:hypothetical protein
LSAGDLRPLIGFAKPGVDILLRVIEKVQLRPGMNTPALMAALAEDPAVDALARLVMLDPPGQAELWAADFSQGLDRLLDEARKQRIADLNELQTEHGLDAATAQELRALLSTRARAGSA